MDRDITIDFAPSEKECEAVLVGTALKVKPYALYYSATRIGRVVAQNYPGPRESEKSDAAQD